MGAMALVISIGTTGESFSQPAEPGWKVAEGTAVFQTAIGTSMTAGGVACFAWFNNADSRAQEAMAVGPIYTLGDRFVLAAGPVLLAGGVPLMISGLVTATRADLALHDPTNRGSWRRVVTADAIVLPGVIAGGLVGGGSLAALIGVFIEAGWFDVAGLVAPLAGVAVYATSVVAAAQGERALPGVYYVEDTIGVAPGQLYKRVGIPSLILGGAYLGGGLVMSFDTRTGTRAAQGVVLGFGAGYLVCGLITMGKASKTIRDERDGKLLAHRSPRKLRQLSLDGIAPWTDDSGGAGLALMGRF